MRQLSIADHGPSAHPELPARSSWGFVCLCRFKRNRIGSFPVSRFPSAVRSPTIASLTRPLLYAQFRVDSGKGQNRTLTPLWPPVFAGEKDVGQDLGLDRQAGVLLLSGCFAEMGGIPGIAMALQRPHKKMKMGWNQLAPQ